MSTRLLSIFKAPLWGLLFILWLPAMGLTLIVATMAEALWRVVLRLTPFDPIMPDPSPVE